MQFISNKERYIVPDCLLTRPYSSILTYVRSLVYGRSFACLAEGEMKFAKCTDLAKETTIAA